YFKCLYNILILPTVLLHKCNFRAMARESPYSRKTRISFSIHQQHYAAAIPGNERKMSRKHNDGLGSKYANRIEAS
ncbi:hypothetical protein L9F63_016284, partial [Diploptera punctata]